SALRDEVRTPHHGRMNRWRLAVLLVLAGCDGAGTIPDAGASWDAGPSAADAGPTVDGGEERDGAAPPACPAGSARIELRCDPELVPCGGDVSGEHCYAEVCFEKDELLADALTQPGIPDGCTTDSIELRGSTGTVEGSIAFTATDV